MTESSLVAIVVGVASSLVALYAVRSSAGLARFSTEQERDRQGEAHRHEEEMAVRTRLLDRRADTYAEVLELLNRSWARVELTMPKIGYGTPVPTPAGQEATWKADALVAVFGSAEMKELMVTLAEIERVFFIEAAYYDDMKADEPPSGKSYGDTYGTTPMEQYRKVDGIRLDYRRAITAVRDRAAVEMGAIDAR